MKLSQMNTNDLAACLCRIAAPMERIAQDKELTKTMGEITKNLEGRSSLQIGMSTLAALLPALLERHREETYTILSILTGKSIEEIGDQNAMLTLRDVRECVDSDFMDFFRSSGASRPEK